MTTSGTYTFGPSVGQLVLNAYGRIQIRRTEITQQHLIDAADESNLLQVEFSNLLPNLWLSETYTAALTQGTATYTLPARLIAPMAVYLTTTYGGNSTDRILTPISTYEYAALPVKTTQAPPTSYWFDRQEEPIMHLWPVPDGNATYTLNMRMVSQPQDAKLPNGQTPEFPYRFLDAFTAGLAARLAVIYRPELEDRRKADAQRAWDIAATQDQEDVPLWVAPMIGTYYR